MQTLPAEPHKKPVSAKTSWDFIKDYFIYSDQRVAAWLYLSGITVSVLGLVGLTLAISWWFPLFWGALIAKAMTPILISIGQFAGIMTGFVALSALKSYFSDKLGIKWRTWLSNKIIHSYLNEQNYLAIDRKPELIKNISQFIQEDIKIFTSNTLELTFGFVRSIFGLGAFGGSLWVLGGALSLAAIGLNVVLPGYLLWVSLIVAIGASFATHAIASSLNKKNQKVEDAEANLRKGLEIVRKNAGNVAQEHAEKYHQSFIKQRIAKVEDTTNTRLKTQTVLVAFQSLYGQLTQILPYLAALPLYLADLFGFESFMQVGFSFGEVSTSFSWFVNAYEDIAKWNAAFGRLQNLEARFALHRAEQHVARAEVEKNLKPEAASSIVVIPVDMPYEKRRNPEKDARKLARGQDVNKRKPENEGTINFRKLSLKLIPDHGSQEYIFHGLNFKLKEGEHVVIRGHSGVGKSSLFKVISENRIFGKGKVTLPYGKSLYFLPQFPTIPDDVSLRQVLAYPDEEKRYSDADCMRVLAAVGLQKAQFQQLDAVRTWSKEVSGGETQKLAFARAILKKPDWLFLDEATSSLDKHSEAHIYETIKKMLPNTTLVSIAHKESVYRFHDKIYTLNVSANDEKKAEMREENIICSKP